MPRSYSIPAPCPFCGGIAVAQGRQLPGVVITFIKCSGCGAIVSFDGKESLKDTLSMFNTRTNIN